MTSKLRLEDAWALARQKSRKHTPAVGAAHTGQQRWSAEEFRQYRRFRLDGGHRQQRGQEAGPGRTVGALPANLPTSDPKANVNREAIDQLHIF